MCKPTFYIIYTSHLRWNSTVRHCFYDTDLGQRNTVFHNFARQIAIIQYSGRSKHAWALAKPLKKFPKSPIRTAGSHFCSANCGECLNEHYTNRGTLQHNKEFIMFIFYFKMVYARHFEYSGKRCSLNDWKQSAQRLKLQETVLTINKRNIIRWNIYRDNNFHSRRQVLKCLWKSLFMF